MPRPVRAPVKSRENFDSTEWGRANHRRMRERWRRATRGQVQSDTLVPRATTPYLRQNMRHMRPEDYKEADRSKMQRLVSKDIDHTYGGAPGLTTEEREWMDNLPHNLLVEADQLFRQLREDFIEHVRELRNDPNWGPDEPDEDEANNIPPLNEVLPELFQNENPDWLINEPEHHEGGMVGGAVNTNWNPYTSKEYLDKKFVFDSKNKKKDAVYRENRRKEKLAQYRNRDKNFYENSNREQILNDLYWGLATPHDLETLYKLDNPQPSKAEQVWDVVKDASRAAVGTFGKVFTPEASELTDTIAGDNTFESVLNKHIDKNSPGNLSELIYAYDPWNYLSDIQEENDAKDEERNEAEDNYRNSYAQATARRSHLNKNDLDAYKGLLSDEEFKKLDKYTNADLSNLSTDQIVALNQELGGLYNDQKKVTDPHDLAVAALKVIQQKRANGTITPEEEQLWKKKQYNNILNPNMSVLTNQSTINKFNNAIGSNRPELDSNGLLIDGEFGGGLLVPGSESKITNKSRRGIIADRPAIRLHSGLANAVQITRHTPLDPGQDNAIPEVTRKRRKVLNEGAGLGPHPVMNKIAAKAVRQGGKAGGGVSLFNYNPSIAGGKVRKQRVKRARKPPMHPKVGGMTFTSLKSTLITPGARV